MFNTYTLGDVNLMAAEAGIVHEEATISTLEPREPVEVPYSVRHRD